jgi:hypothetical protein
MGRRRRQGNSSSQWTNNLIEDLVGKEENEYPVPDPKRMMINMTREHNDVHEKISQRGNYE